MAEEKNSFILYTDLINVVSKLVLKDRENGTNYGGELFLLILQYVNDLNPIPINFIVEMAFEPIKLQLKRDLVKYENKKDTLSDAGALGNLKRWNLDLYKKVTKNKMLLSEAVEIAKNRKLSPPDKLPSPTVGFVAVNVNVNDTVSEIKEIKKENWKNIEEYLEYRESEFYCLDESFQQALKDKIGIDRPYCWTNRKFPQGYFDLVDCLVKVKNDVEWRSSIQINNNISKQMLLERVYEFVKEIKDTRIYMSYDGYDGSDGKENFITHFVRWLKFKINK